MKFLIMSDNHGRYLTVQELLQYWRSQVDYIFHTGDSEIPADDPIWNDVDAVVRGNMDFDPGFPESKMVDTPEGVVYLVHGHLNKVNRGLEPLFKDGKNRGATFIFHGHTHQLYANYSEDILMMNPGSLNQSRGQHPERTFAVVDIQPEQITVEYYDDENQLIPRLTEQFDRN
ncbi:metallophosphoesterase [Aerococcaceae bacterium DSM 111020]|nr:metallophosphoesterase [Aerococcaceae bacterium DSM 111020]